MLDVADLREHWATCGPPAHIGIAVISASLGNRLTREHDEQPAETLPIPAGAPTIAELAAGVSLRPGQDTVEASRLILERFGARQARDLA